VFCHVVRERIRIDEFSPEKKTPSGRRGSPSTLSWGRARRWCWSHTRSRARIHWYIIDNSQGVEGRPAFGLSAFAGYLWNFMHTIRNNVKYKQPDKKIEIRLFDKLVSQLAPFSNFRWNIVEVRDRHDMRAFPLCYWWSFCRLILRMRQPVIRMLRPACSNSHIANGKQQSISRTLSSIHTYQGTYIRSPTLDIQSRRNIRK
jgi:hypothetical protein